MIFKSLYPRLVLVLAVVTLGLFVILTVVNAYYFKITIGKLMTELQTERLNRLFVKLDQRFAPGASSASVAAYIDSIYFEYNLEVYNPQGQRLASHVPAMLNETGQDKTAFNTFAQTYRNPNPASQFAVIQIYLQPPHAPVFRKMLILLIISGFFIVAVSFFVGWKLIAYLNRRLERLKIGVSKIAEGDFSMRLDERGEDEIAFLAKSFNLMSSRLQRLIENLEESNAARQRLFAHASHEIKSPLTSIKGFVDIIEYMNVLPEAQQKQILPAAKKDLQRVIKIANDLLQLARVRDPQYKFDLKETDLAALLREEHRFFAQRAASNNATATFECPVVGRLTLNIDPDRLSQILDNLWSNSLKYGDLSQPIQTRLFVENGSASIMISNNLKNKLTVPAERLFEPFYRQPSDADKTTGSGLGLAIVKELTEKLGGKVEASVDQQALTIKIRLPLPEDKH